MKILIKKFHCISKQLFIFSIIALLNTCDFIIDDPPQQTPKEKRKYCLEQSILTAAIFKENGAIKEKNVVEDILFFYIICNRPSK